MGSRVRASSAPQRERNSVSLSFFIPPLAYTFVGFCSLLASSCVLRFVFCALRFALCVLRFALCVLCFASCALCLVLCVLCCSVSVRSLVFVLEVCLRPGGFCRENLPSGHKKKGDAFPWTSSLSGELLQGNLMPPLSAQSLIRLCNSHTRGILCGT